MATALSYSRVRYQKLRNLSRFSKILRLQSSICCQERGTFDINSTKFFFFNYFSFKRFYHVPTKLIFGFIWNFWKESQIIYCNVIVTHKYQRLIHLDWQTTCLSLGAVSCQSCPWLTQILMLGKNSQTLLNFRKTLRLEDSKT